MSDEKKNRLGVALNAAEALKAAMPKPKENRTARMMILLTASERAKLGTLAEERGEPAATTARNLIVAALEAMGR